MVLALALRLTDIEMCWRGILICKVVHVLLSGVILLSFSGVEFWGAPR